MNNVTRKLLAGVVNHSVESFCEYFGSSIEEFFTKNFKINLEETGGYNTRYVTTSKRINDFFEKEEEGLVIKIFFRFVNELIKLQGTKSLCQEPYYSHFNLSDDDIFLYLLANAVDKLKKECGNRYITKINNINFFLWTARNVNIILYTEGKTDQQILSDALKKLDFYLDVKVKQMGGAKNLSNELQKQDIGHECNVIFGIFDFDQAYNDFNGLKEKNGPKWSEIKGTEQSCLYKSYKNKHALLLPIPKSRKNLASRIFKEKSTLSIELLFEDELLKKHNLKEVSTA